MIAKAAEKDRLCSRREKKRKDEKGVMKNPLRLCSIVTEEGTPLGSVFV